MSHAEMNQCLVWSRRKGLPPAVPDGSAPRFALICTALPCTHRLYRLYRLLLSSPHRYLHPFLVGRGLVPHNDCISAHPRKRISCEMPTRIQRLRSSPPRGRMRLTGASRLANVRINLCFDIHLSRAPVVCYVLLLASSCGPIW